MAAPWSTGADNQMHWTSCQPGTFVQQLAIYATGEQHRFACLWRGGLRAERGRDMSCASFVAFWWTPTHAFLVNIVSFPLNPPFFVIPILQKRTWTARCTSRASVYVNWGAGGEAIFVPLVAQIQDVVSPSPFLRCMVIFLFLCLSLPRRIPAFPPACSRSRDLLRASLCLADLRFQ
jgi:hypothetical protein